MDRVQEWIDTGRQSEFSVVQSAEKDDWEGEFAEVSDEELLQLADDVVFESGFDRTIDPMVLPFSLEETYELFFGDEAPYFIGEPFKALGHDVKSVTEWGPIMDDSFKESVDANVK